MFIQSTKVHIRKPEVAFLCPHSEVPGPISILPDSETSSSQHVLHPAVVLTEKSRQNKTVVKCTQKAKLRYELTKEYDNWLSACFPRRDNGGMCERSLFLSSESEEVKGELVCLCMYSL